MEKSGLIEWVFIILDLRKKLEAGISAAIRLFLWQDREG